MQTEILSEPNIGQKPSRSLRVTNEIVIVDEEDFAFVCSLGLSIVRRGDLKHVYINTQPYYKQPLHRILLRVDDPNVTVDHKNRNGLDNRRENLRATNKVGNALNMSVNKNKKSGLPKGVYRKGDKFKAQIKVDGLEFYLGSYKTPDKAEKAYKRANENYWAGKPIRS